jgi:hypothetical protein
MPSLLPEHYIDLALGLGVLLLLIAAGGCLLRRLRGRAGDDRKPASDVLTKFREMESRGDLSDAEYRTIRTVLARPFPDESNRDDEKG